MKQTGKERCRIKKVNYNNHTLFKRKKDKHSTENWWHHNVSVRWYRSTERRKREKLTQNTHPSVIPCTDTNQQVSSAPNHSLIKPSLDQIPVLNPTINQNLWVLNLLKAGWGSARSKPTQSRCQTSHNQKSHSHNLRPVRIQTQHTPPPPNVYLQSKAVTAPVPSEISRRAKTLEEILQMQSTSSRQKRCSLILTAETLDCLQRTSESSLFYRRMNWNILSLSYHRRKVYHPHIHTPLEMMSWDLEGKAWSRRSVLRPTLVADRNVGL